MNLTNITWCSRQHLQALCCHFRPDPILLGMGVDPNLGHMSSLFQNVLQRMRKLVHILSWHDHDHDHDGCYPAPSVSTNVSDGFIDNHT